nr:uncharacterized protein LOC120366826 [Saimiri boliviensis boliviensis]
MGLPSPPRPLLMSASLALAPPAPTSRPQAHCIGADAPARRGGCKLAGTHGARGAEGLGGGDARGRRQLPPARPWQPRAEVGGARGSRRAEPSGGGGGFPFLPEPSPGVARGRALKRAGNLVYRPRRGADRAFVWKVSISRSGCDVFLVTLASGRPAGGGGSPGSRLLSGADRAGDFCAFVLILGNLSFFSSLARCRACPDLAAAPTTSGLGAEPSLAGLPAA